MNYLIFRVLEVRNTGLKGAELKEITKVIIINPEVKFSKIIGCWPFYFFDFFGLLQ